MRLLSTTGGMDGALQLRHSEHSNEEWVSCRVFAVDQFTPDGLQCNKNTNTHTYTNTYVHKHAYIIIELYNNTYILFLNCIIISRYDS